MPPLFGSKLLAALAFALTFAFSQLDLAAETVVMKAQPFPLDHVELLDGPFRHAMELNVAALLRYQPDRFLANFRKEAGLPPRTEHYGGWESNTISGHSLGHYLSACSLMLATTGDERFRKRVNYIVDELAECQAADGDGYVGAIPDGKRILVTEVAQGNIRSKGFDLNGIWVPLYTQHKLLAGLRDAYRLDGNEKALQVACKLADWFCEVLMPLSHEQTQKMLHCEHGGINEVFADLYADTGEQRYLDLSNKLHHDAVLGPLAEGVDCLPGIHANTQVPKLVGLARRYELTGNEDDRKAAEFFWDRVVNHHSYVTGGHCFNEYFGEPDQLNDRLGPNTTETCNVYNMLKLSRHLFQWTADADVADFYERALYNHILSSQHPEDGRVIYNLTLEMGGCKHYQDPESFTCCVGTGMENHAKYGEAIYFHGDDSLYVNLFIASQLDWKEKGVILRQETNYPNDDTTSLRFTCRQPTRLALKIRHPYWAESGIELTVNGESLASDSKPSDYVTIDRTWDTGDVVKLTMPMPLRLEAMPDNPRRVAVMYGPLVLAGELGPVDSPDASNPDFVPVLIGADRPVAEWVKPIEGEANTFQMVDVGRPRNVVLRPFYETHDCRYTIFWDKFTEDDWAKRQAEYEAERKRQAELEARTIDVVQPGEMQPERDHNMQGERTSAGKHAGRGWRHAYDGWFSFDMKIDPSVPVILQATYWGDETGNRDFDVLIDEKKIASQKLHRNCGPKFFTVDYPIPAELTKDKEKITVRFQAHQGNFAGGLFGLRVLRQE